MDGLNLQEEEREDSPHLLQAVDGLTHGKTEIGNTRHNTSTEQLIVKDALSRHIYFIQLCTPKPVAKLTSVLKGKRPLNLDWGLRSMLTGFIPHFQLSNFSPLRDVGTEFVKMNEN